MMTVMYWGTLQQTVTGSHDGLSGQCHVLTYLPLVPKKLVDIHDFVIQVFITRT